jgi:sugar-phosphatase
MSRPVVFDLDGVLVDSEPLYELAFARFMGEPRHPDHDELIALTLGRREADFVPELAERLHRSAEEIHEDLRSATLPLLNELAPMPFAAEVVSALRADPRPIAIATSSGAAFTHGALERLGIDALVDAVVTGDEVEWGKPDPAIYLVAAERLSVDPGVCVAIEDTPAGVAAARAAGMACIAIPHALSPPAGLAEADAIVRDLNAATSEVRRLDRHLP